MCGVGLVALGWWQVVVSTVGEEVALQQDRRLVLDLLAKQSSQAVQSLSSERESKLSWLVSSPHPQLFYRSCS